MNMEVEGLGGEASVPNRSFYPSAFGAHSGRSSSGATVYSLSDGSSLSPEPLTSYVSFHNPTSGANTQVTFGCNFTNSCFSCKAPPSAVFQQTLLSHGAGNVSEASADQQDTVSFSRTALRCTEVPARLRDLGVYPAFQRIPRYLDMPVVPRARTSDHSRESPFAAEGYQPWNWSTSWSGQVYCPEKQTQSSHIWKSSLTEDTALCAADSRRVRKKRVPYTKLQLKELEHEYTITKFITKERRRRIASSTSLSERQVTIWFQNRRVKDKKIISKISKDFEPYQ